MRTDAQPPTGGIYRPRNPRALPITYHPVPDIA